eukprot:7476529-Heterocapsa_arctica.AAC.1
MASKEVLQRFGCVCFVVVFRTGWAGKNFPGKRRKEYRTQIPEALRSAAKLLFRPFRPQLK